MVPTDFHPSPPLHRYRNSSHRYSSYPSPAPMGDKPLLPSVKSLLNMSDSMDISDHHRNSHSYDHGHSSMQHSHQRSRSSRLDRDSHPSSSSRHRRPDHHQRHHHHHHSSANSNRNSSSYGRNETVLPSVNEVLRSARNGQDSAHVNWNDTPSRSHAQPQSSSHGHHSSGSTSSRQGYPCERCGRLFTRKSDANKHIRVVHDRLMLYPCSVCGRRFARKDYCTKHEKSLHNVVPPPTPYQLRRQLAKQKAESKREEGK